MANKYIIDLTAAEHEELCRLLKQGKPSARKVARAHMPLHAAEGATEERMAPILRGGFSPVPRPRQRFVEGGLPSALIERRRPGAIHKLDGKQEAFLVALACSTPPAGRVHWTMQLLAERLVTLQLVEAISDETVRRVLKKTTSSRGSAKNGASPV